MQVEIIFLNFVFQNPKLKTMSTNNSNIINGYDLVQAKSALPQFIQCSTRYKELSQLFSQTEYQETLLDIITTTIKPHQKIPKL